VIAYGLHIGARVEMSTLGETINAQFFSEPESCAFYRDSNSGICEPPIILSSYPPCRGATRSRERPCVCAEIADPVGTIEGATYQIATLQGMFRPWHDDVSERYIGSSLITR
jgi:hypothetical protein